ncbi:MAG: 50S ribosomal protein L30 [Phototrophicales bacterium]|nr:MAG: 50S ribosomal protein L30 [Phototrophicales bacterium]
MSQKRLRIKLIRSMIGTKQNQRATLKSLGLRKINQEVVQDDTPSIRGKINTVQHLVSVEEVE